MTITLKDEGFPVKITLKNQNFSKTFNKAEDVQNFYAVEQAFWVEINSQLQAAGILHNNLRQTQKTYTAQYLQKLLKHSSNDAQALASLQLLDRNPAIMSEGKQGKKIVSLASTNPSWVTGYIIAVHAFLASRLDDWSGFGDNNVSRIELLSSLGAMMNLIEEKGNGGDRKAVADDLIAELQSMSDSIISTKSDFETWNTIHTQEWSGKLEAFQEQIDKDVAAQTEIAETSISSAVSDLNKTMRQQKQRVDELQKQVRDRLILEAPTKYWETKANRHTGYATAFGILFAGILGVGIWVLLTHGVSFVADASQKIVGNSQDPGFTALIPIAFITVPVLAFAWLLRHISRIVIQNLSLGADARLRSTIALTYSALTLEQTATEAQLAIALHALFRPIDSNDHAEIAPPNLEDILKMSKGKS